MSFSDKPRQPIRKSCVFVGLAANAGNRPYNYSFDTLFIQTYMLTL